MNLTFTDISNAFSNMVQQENPKEIISGLKNWDSEKPQFAEKLSEVVKKIENFEKSSSFFTSRSTNANPKIDSVQNDSEKIMNFLSKILNKEKGTDFVAALQNIFLMLSNHDLKNVSLDADGLEALKKMLVKAGFKENDINDLIAGLLEGQENNSIPVKDLLDKLFEFDFEPQPLAEKESEKYLDIQPLTEEKYEKYLEISALPFLESLMNSLNIEQDKIKEILTKADKGEKGLDLDLIINKLQDLQKESFYTGNQYKTHENDNNFTLLLKQMGLEKEYSKTSSLSLGDFVDSLENLRKKILHKDVVTPLGLNDQGNTGTEKNLDIVNALFKGLKFESKESKAQIFEFSEGQIKNQFKNQLLMPDTEKANESKLFVLGKTFKQKHDTSIKYGLKEIESMLDGKKNTVLETKNQTLGNKEFIKQFKSEVAKIIDQTQTSGLDTKAGDTQSYLHNLKTKASFKNLPGYVTQQVSKSLVRAINQGESTLKIQLKPPELGRLMIVINNSGNNIKVNIVTENHAAREILASNVNELRATLSNSGVNLERFDVDMNSNFRQSMADARNQPGQFSRRNKNKDKDPSDPANGGNINESISVSDILKQNGSLHFVA